VADVVKKPSLFELAYPASTVPPLRKSPSPIPCRGYEINTPDMHEYDCSYEYPPECERCVVNGGPIDPRTGKRYRKPKGG
jgi:hypothetical protein